MNIQSTSIGQWLRSKQFITPSWGALVFPYHIIRSALYHALLPFAGQVEGRVLDFGCGSKPYESLFGRAREYIGVDVAQSSHDHTNSKVDVFFDGAQLPFDDESFDCVVCFEVLEHVPDLDLALGEISRVLKPDGKFLASIPFAYPEHETPFDFRRLTEFAVRDSWDQAGFTIADLVRTGTNWLAIKQLQLDYFTQAVMPGDSMVMRGLRIPFVALLNLWAYGSNAVLPKLHSLPLNFVVWARKPAASCPAVRLG